MGSIHEYDSQPTPGPYLMRLGSLWQARRTHNDTNDTLLTAILPDAEKLVVKDMFNIKGLRTSVGNRDFFNLYPPCTDTASAIQCLIDAGAEILGESKLSSFAAREEPMESIDFQAPFNPRGDGYQSPAGSSSGSAAAVSSYNWLDFAIGSDTTGSGRRPALWNGCFSLRPTKTALSLEGFVKTFERQREDAIERLKTFKGWFLDKVMRVDDYTSFMVSPIEEVASNYRDEPPASPTMPKGIRMLDIAPTLAAPELAIPIAELSYESRVSNRTEFLPVAVSLMGPPGSNGAESLKSQQPPMGDEAAEDQSTVDAEGFRRVTRRLYTSHTLSTWNSRMFEFGAFLFLADVFPETLLFASVYALARSLAVFLLSSWIGGIMDGSNRLWAIRASIMWQRIPVAASCVIFLLLNSCGEGLDLNAVMRRIDLIAKLVAPLSVAFVHATLTKAALWAVLASNITSVLIEYVAIAQVHDAVLALARPLGNPERPMRNMDPLGVEEPTTIEHRSHWKRVQSWFEKVTLPWSLYFRSPLLLASLSLSILYLTVLSFNAQMVTYLLTVGYSALWVAILRLLSVVVELGATWAAPIVMSRIGPVRSGLWFITWQFGCAAVGVAIFNMTVVSQQLNVTALVTGTVFSRIGLWGFDLSIQYIIQEGVPPGHRSQFSATEAALQNLFEVLSFATTTVFARPKQFNCPALISVGAIGVANTCFAVFVRQNRGHLFHTSKCLTRKKYQKIDQMDESETG
ncbi:MAG: hypothetical protein Q9173_001655 [Seirophora scorigena]